MSSKKDKSLYGTVRRAKDLASVTDDLIKHPPKELTERQRRIVNFRLRGLTQKAIAKVENISQPMVAKEMRKIREVYKEKGRTIDSDQVLGESVSLYQEIEVRGWELYHTHKNEKPSVATKALDTIMTSREKTIKLMMDLGIMKKAAKEVEHKIQVAPFLEQFASLDKEDKQSAFSNIINVSLSELEEPEPPQLEEDFSSVREREEEEEEEKTNE